jgi:glycolate oxidase FAD binding subunit
MSGLITPTRVAGIADAVRAAASARTPIEITAGGTRRGLGRPVQAGMTLSTTALSGITLYEPAELVIAARAGTPLAHVEAALAEKGQMLPFEPLDHRPLLGTTGEPTIGGAVAANASGPRRISVGACRDALIGTKFVNGRGEEIVSGGRVMKNVTGYDLLKLQCGAYGTLGILTEVTFKVLPRPAAEMTLVYAGLDDRTGVAALCAGLGTPYEVTGAAHIPGARPRTLMRLENFPVSLTYRSARLIDELARFGRPEIIEGADSAALWRDVAALAALPREGALWRVSTAPTKGPDVIAALGTRAVAHMYDWSGGLVWIVTEATGDACAAFVRAAVAVTGGHATLIRAPETIRAVVPPFQPPSAAVASLGALTKASFDPQGILNPGRMSLGH